MHLSALLCCFGNVLPNSVQRIYSKPRASEITCYNKFVVRQRPLQRHCARQCTHHSREGGRRGDTKETVTMVDASSKGSVLRKQRRQALIGRPQQNDLTIPKILPQYTYFLVVQLYPRASEFPSSWSLVFAAGNYLQIHGLLQ